MFLTYKEKKVLIQNKHEQGIYRNKSLNNKKIFSTHLDNFSKLYVTNYYKYLTMNKSGFHRLDHMICVFYLRLDYWEEFHSACSCVHCGGTHIPVLVLCGTAGGNLAGQQFVSNIDPFRAQTSFPEASWELHQERRTQEVITICIEIGLTSASTPSEPCPKPDWTQQMLVEVEPRDEGGAEMTAGHCLSTPTIVWNEKRREGGGKRKRELLITGI